MHYIFWETKFCTVFTINCRSSCFRSWWTGNVTHLRNISFSIKNCLWLITSGCISGKKEAGILLSRKKIIKSSALSWLKKKTHGRSRFSLNTRVSGIITPSSDVSLREPPWVVLLVVAFNISSCLLGESVPIPTEPLLK